MNCGMWCQLGGCSTTALGKRLNHFPNFGQPLREQAVGTTRGHAKGETPTTSGPYQRPLFKSGMTASWSWSAWTDRIQVRGAMLRPRGRAPLRSLWLIPPGAPCRGPQTEPDEDKTSEEKRLTEKAPYKFADRVQIKATRLKRVVTFWFSRSRLSTVAPFLSFDPPTPRQPRGRADA